MTQRLQSFYSNNRKEAAYTLGHLGDPRAVPSLIHALKYDISKDVRIAAAIGLGEIGGSDAAVALERASIYDHREDVRRAATTALTRLNAKAKTSAPVSSRVVPQTPAPRPPVTPAPSPFGGSSRSGEPALETPGAIPDATQSPGEPSSSAPPPPPTPVTSGAAGAGNGQ
jgi:hypothetical protein